MNRARRSCALGSANERGRLPTGDVLFCEATAVPGQGMPLLLPARRRVRSVVPAQVPDRLVGAQPAACGRLGIVGDQHLPFPHREERPLRRPAVKIADHIQRILAIVPFVGKNVRVLVSVERARGLYDAL